jgi:hypothetical protein
MIELTGFYLALVIFAVLAIPRIAFLVTWIAKAPEAVFSGI